LDDWSDRNICQEVVIKTAILSVTAPGVGIEPDLKVAARLVRDCNEHNAAIRDADPAAYGFFAALPDISLDIEWDTARD
jgi:hypothetical protein